MRHVYLDNASTTPIREEVILAMTEVLHNNFGNPSSTYAMGRSAKAIIETARKQIAKYLNATAQEIIFTATATEANNWILRNAVQQLQVKRIITSKIEHHAVLNTVLELQKEYGIEVSFVNLVENGNIDYTHLGELLKDQKPTLVSLMHVNNETGNILDLHKVAVLCKEHSAYFHSDTVQSMGKISFDLNQTPIDFLVATAHKFHGPKGVGFLFSRKGIQLKPLYFGGGQEKGIRPGTESTHQIIGLAKALELSYQQLESEHNYLKKLRNYLIQKLDENFLGYRINGDVNNGAPHILNIQFPFEPSTTATILFSLDMKGIAVSRGSACQSGSISQSHVLIEMLIQEELTKPSLRISLSHFNTTEDIDLLIKALHEL
ncbi:MAG TPA: cysteine desulfurase family protein [Flavobacterium sp.]|nr:cysteine desulfurase family protein [Flavobacterium sp.]